MRCRFERASTGSDLGSGSGHHHSLPVSQALDLLGRDGGLARGGADGRERAAATGRRDAIAIHGAARARFLARVHVGPLPLHPRLACSWRSCRADLGAGVCAGTDLHTLFALSVLCAASRFPFYIPSFFLPFHFCVGSRHVRRLSLSVYFDADFALGRERDHDRNADRFVFFCSPSALSSIAPRSGVYDPKDPFNNNARPNSWTPPLNGSWTWGQDHVYGVNLGGLFVLEPFIAPALYQKYPGTVDEWTLSEAMAADTASGGLQQQLENHYNTFVVRKALAWVGRVASAWLILPSFSCTSAPADGTRLGSDRGGGAELDSPPHSVLGDRDVGGRAFPRQGLLEVRLPRRLPDRSVV